MPSEQPMCSGAPGCSQRHPEDFDCGKKWATEHSKLRKIKDKSDAIGSFLDWMLDEQGWRICDQHQHEEGCYVGGESLTRICELRNGDYFPVPLTTEKILAEYFEIDLKKLSEEKDRMLEEVRDAQETTGVDQR